MWLAGAYEGFTASMLWCLDRKLHIEEIIGRDLKAYIHSDVSLGNAVMKLAEERCVEALSLYSRNIAFAGLEVECALKVARMYEKAPPSSEIEDKEQKVLTCRTVINLRYISFFLCFIARCSIFS